MAQGLEKDQPSEHQAVVLIKQLIISAWLFMSIIAFQLHNILQGLLPPPSYKGGIWVTGQLTKLAQLVGGNRI